MASPTKLTVDFKPTKRIKKRRELDALVSTKQRNLGKSGTSSVTGKPEFLRNESETSEMEEFDMPAKTLLQRRSRSCTCSMCVRLGCGVLLAACLFSICGLVWMFMELRKDLNELRVKLAKVDELSSNIPDQLQDLKSSQRNLRLQLEQFDGGLNILRTNISIIVGRVKGFDDSLKTLGRDMDHWKAMQPPRPSDAIGIVNKDLVRSRLSDEEADDEMLLEQLPLKKLSWTEKKLSFLNATVHRRLEEMKAHSALVDVSISALNNYTTLLGKRLGFLEVPPGGDKKTSSSELYLHVSHVLQSQIEMLHTSIGVISGKLDAVVSSLERLHNSTDSKIGMLGLTARELSARLKLVEVTVHMMLSDNVASEATPGGKLDQGPVRSSAAEAFPSSSSSTTENQMKIRRSAALLETLPRS